MLILTRKLGECLKIGELGDVLDGPVTVTVLETRGDQVRIGIAAQRDVRVDREEIRQRIDRERLDQPRLAAQA